MVSLKINNRTIFFLGKESQNYMKCLWVSFVVVGLVLWFIASDSIKGLWCQSILANTGKPNERKSEQDHTPQTPTMLDNAAHNKWQCHALVMDNSIKLKILNLLVGCK